MCCGSKMNSQNQADIYWVYVDTKSPVQGAQDLQYGFRRRYNERWFLGARHTTQKMSQSAKWAWGQWVNFIILHHCNYANVSLKLLVSIKTWLMPYLLSLPVSNEHWALFIPHEQSALSALSQPTVTDLHFHLNVAGRVVNNKTMVGWTR